MVNSKILVQNVMKESLMRIRDVFLALFPHSSVKESETVVLALLIAPSVRMLKSVLNASNLCFSLMVKLNSV